MKDFEKGIIKELNNLHLSITKKGNSKHSKEAGEHSVLYKIVTTPKYVCIKCNVHRKCRFAVWYSMTMGDGSEPLPEKIKYCRTINNNHDIEFHKEESIY
jgi:hypothetical protein